MRGYDVQSSRQAEADASQEWVWKLHTGQIEVVKRTHKGAYSVLRSPETGNRIR